MPGGPGGGERPTMRLLQWPASVTEVRPEGGRWKCALMIDESCRNGPEHAQKQRASIR